MAMFVRTRTKRELGRGGGVVRTVLVMSDK